MKKVSLLFFAATVAIAGGLHSQTYSASLVRLFKDVKEQPNDLARYVYLTRVLPKLDQASRSPALQLLAFSESELGLYNEALRDFPLRSPELVALALPRIDQWRSERAADAIARMAVNRHLVLVNEAHHDAHTRELTLALLPKLRQLGFNYFAAEAIGEDDPDLDARGYPTDASGTEYVHEPLYGEIVREALRLGFKVVPYDSRRTDVQGRESEQAENLYRRVFAKDPDARLFVHAGYAHIDKAPGRLGRARPMAMLLAKLSGFEPLSVDQTQFREQIPQIPGPYQTLTEEYRPEVPTVLVNRTNGTAWSASPTQYDVSVILPAEKVAALTSGSVRTQVIIHDATSGLPLLSPKVNAQRPGWLDLNGVRSKFVIRSSLCKASLPCVVEARYSGESDRAIAADRYAFTVGDSASALYLKPGRYNLLASDAKGRTLSQFSIEVGK